MKTPRDPHDDDLLLIHRLMIDAETLRQAQSGRRLMATVSLTEIADNLSEAALVIHELETSMASRAPRLAPPKPRPTVTMEHEPEMRPDIVHGQRARSALSSSASIAERWLKSEKGQMLTGPVVNHLREDIEEHPEVVVAALQNKNTFLRYAKTRNPKISGLELIILNLWRRYHGFAARWRNRKKNSDPDPNPIGNSASPGGEHDDARD